MKAMVLTGIREMEMTEMPAPEIRRPTDVLVRIGAVGVCGSDVHYYTTGHIGSHVVQYPFAVGHECAGTVEAVGESVTRVHPGDRVAIEPAMNCGHCDQCRTGRSNTCRKLTFLGCPGQAQGCLSEFLVMPETCCFPIGEATPLALAAFSEPLAIGVYAVNRSVPMKDARVGILGMGPIGFSVMLPARRQGATVYTTDKVPERRAMAMHAGAQFAGDPDSETVPGEILQAEPRGLDVVFECCGEQEALDQALTLLKPGGTLMLVGIPTVERISFAIDTMRRKEICLRNIRRQEGCVQTALDLLEHRDIDIAPLITHRFPFDDTKTAFDLVAAYRDGVIKAMIEFP